MLVVWGGDGGRIWQWGPLLPPQATGGPLRGPLPEWEACVPALQALEHQAGALISYPESFRGDYVQEKENLRQGKDREAIYFHAQKQVWNGLGGKVKLSSIV